MDALIAELIQPLLPTKMVPKPPIPQQAAVARQVSKNRPLLLHDRSVHRFSSESTERAFLFFLLFAFCFLLDWMSCKIQDCFLRQLK
jgi:hypothetical protein